MQLNFPTYKFKTKSEQDIHYVFDSVRKKYVVLTPEEWVRQHVLQYLSEDKGYPNSLIAVERGLSVNGRNKRFDVLTFDNQGKPFLLVECKSPEVALNKAVFEQISIYNSAFGVKLLWVTNGLQHVYVRYTDDFSRYEFLEELPKYGG